jgi:transglutaminase-like putative cysteine protease
VKRLGWLMLLLLYPRLLVAQEADPRELEGRHWYGLYFNEQKAGYAVHELKVDDAGTVVVTEDAVFNVNMGQIAQRMRVFTQRTYAAGGDLVSINMSVEDPSGTKQFIAATDAEIMMFRTIRGEDRTEEVRARPAESLSDVLRQYELVTNGPAVGDEISFTMFEPLYAQEVTGTSRIEAIHEKVIDGERRTVYEVHSVLDLVPVESVAMVLDNGVTYRDQVAGIIEMRLETEEEATKEVPVPDVVTSNAAHLDEPIADARTRESLTLRLRGPLGPEHLIEDARQSFMRDGDAFHFLGHRRNPGAVQAMELPLEALDDELAQWLEPSLYVQSDDERLIDKAAEIIGNETGAFEAAKLLNNWVFANVRKTFSARLSEALEVLENLEGDCTEHSVLFVGLARAAGIPAREVAGLVYVEAPEPGFYFHQWAKVWVGEWVDMDPTFDQVTVDATHIKLAVGDLLEQAQLIPIIGKIEAKVVDEAALAEAE